MADGIDPDAEARPASLVCFWNIAFLSSDSRNWWRWFSPRWCRHVMAFGYVPATDSWVVVENGDTRFIVLGIPDDQFTDWLDAVVRRSSVILRFEARDCHAHAHRIGNWCSTTVARLAGVPGGAWRPLALYRSLIRAGAKPVFGTNLHVGQGKSAQGRRGDEAPPRAG